MNSIYLEHLSADDRDFLIEESALENDYRKAEMMFNIVDMQKEQMRYEAEFKVLSESGTYDDLVLLYEEVDKEASEKNKGIFQSIFSWFAKIFKKISDFFGNIRKGVPEEEMDNKVEIEKEDDDFLTAASEAFSVSDELFSELSKGTIPDLGKCASLANKIKDLFSKKSTKVGVGVGAAAATGVIAYKKRDVLSKLDVVEKFSNKLKDIISKLENIPAVKAISDTVEKVIPKKDNKPANNTGNNNTPADNNGNNNSEQTKTNNDNGTKTESVNMFIEADENNQTGTNNNGAAENQDQEKSRGILGALKSISQGILKLLNKIKNKLLGIKESSTQNNNDGTPDNNGEPEKEDKSRSSFDPNEKPNEIIDDGGVQRSRLEKALPSGSHGQKIGSGYKPITWYALRTNGQIYCYDNANKKFRIVPDTGITVKSIDGKQTKVVKPDNEIINYVQKNIVNKKSSYNRESDDDLLEEAKLELGDSYNIYQKTLRNHEFICIEQTISDVDVEKYKSIFGIDYSSEVQESVTNNDINILISLLDNI